MDMDPHHTPPAMRRGQSALLAELKSGGGGVPPGIFLIKAAIRAYLPEDDNLLVREKQFSTLGDL
jgi:hypothetical protein